MNRKPIISIVIPVYNVENYLHDCLSSIQYQTFENWEAILINDGSKDGSGAICDDFVDKDSRFHVIHATNGGVSRARNIGLDMAQGDWVCFCDSDDCLTSDALSCMLNCVTNTGADVCLCPIVREGIHNDNRVTVLDNEEKLELIVSCLSYRTDKYVKQGYMVDAPHAKLFRNSVIQNNKIRFVEGLSKSEDAIFDAYFYHYANRVVFYTHQVYHYTINPNSISHTFNWKTIDMLVWLLCEERKFIEQFYAHNTEIMDFLYIRSYVGLEQLLYESGTKTLSFCQHINAVKKYIENEVVHNLLMKCSNCMFHKYFPGVTKYTNLRLAQHRLSFLLYSWVLLNTVIFQYRVKIISVSKKILGIDENVSIRTLLTE